MDMETLLLSDCTVCLRKTKYLEGSKGNIERFDRDAYCSVYIISSPPTGVKSGYGTLLHSDCTVCLRWIKILGDRKGILEGF